MPVRSRISPSVIKTIITQRLRLPLWGLTAFYACARTPLYEATAVDKSARAAAAVAVGYSTCSFSNAGPPRGRGHDKGGVAAPVRCLAAASCSTRVLAHDAQQCLALSVQDILLLAL